MSRRVRIILTKGYHLYLDNREFSVEDGLSYWREKIFNGLMLVFIIFGSIAMIPNIIASIDANAHLITFTNIIIYVAILFIFYNRSIPLKIKISIVIFFIYFLSLVLLIMLGPMGPGFIWLASSSIIAALLLGMRASIITLVVNTIIIIILAILIYFKVFTTLFFETYTVTSWIAVSANVIVFNSITSIPFALLINALEKTILSEKQLKAELIKKNEKTLSEKEMALESDRLKSAFLANLSHEIRTPMNAIVGFSELIKTNSEENSKINKFSQYIIHNSGHLLNLINDIVDISLIESGHIHLSYRFFSLQKVVDSISATIEASELYQKRPLVKLTYEIDPLLDQVYIDEGRVTQILINLITNSLKYTPEGSINVKIVKKGNYMQTSVQDNGVGIPKVEQEKIFNRFSKIERKGSYNMPGIGLGLSITKGLCEAMNGKIWFESEIEIGTTFTFILPIDNTEPA